jgi:Ni/Fe-hydrogenase 1 B-type cytochrome subunit
MAKAEDHPFAARVSHWINLLSFAILGTTGFIIHSPGTVGAVNLVRNLHFVFMWVLLINGVFRIYYSIFGKHRDYKEFLFTATDFKKLFPIIKYYLFLGDHPNTGKYNPLQKAAYLGLFLFAALQGLTGLALYKPEAFSTLANLFGGLASTRGVHYFLTWVFMAIVLTHIYLALSEAWDQARYMFFGVIDNKKSKS